MDALQYARWDVEKAEGDVDFNGVVALAARAGAYAAIAQAEQLKRIADALEIMAHPNRIVAPDPQDYYSEDEYNAAAERYDYHKNSRPGESMDEYKARRAAEYA